MIARIRQELAVMNWGRVAWLPWPRSRRLAVVALISLLMVTTGAAIVYWPVKLALFCLFIIVLAAWAMRGRLGQTRPKLAHLAALGLILAAALAANDTRLALAAWWWAALYLIVFWWATSEAGQITPRVLCWAAFPLMAYYLIELAARGVFSRPGGLLGNANTHAMVIAMLFPCGLAAWLSPGDRWSSLWLALALANLAGTQSAVGLVSVGSGVLVFALMRSPLKNYLVAAGCLVVLAIVLALAVLALAGIRSLGEYPLSRSLAHRLAFWRVALDIWRANPLAGVGPRGISQAFYNQPVALPVGNHAHSGPLQIAAETGIIGLAAAGLVVSDGWRRVRRGTGPVGWAAAGGLAALAVGQIIGYTLWLPAVVLLAVALLAMCGSRLSAGGSMLFLPQDGRPSRLAQHAVSLVLVVVVLGAAWSLWGEAPAWRAVQLARRGDFAAASWEYRRAAQRDPLAIYDQGRADALAALAISGEVAPVLVLTLIEGLDSWPWDAARREAIRAGECLPAPELARHKLGVTLEVYRRSAWSGVC